MSNHQMSAPQRRRVRPKIWERDGRQCFWCYAPLTLDEMTLDHFVTRAAGGSNAMENLRCACSSCNKRRGKTEAGAYLAKGGSHEWRVVGAARN